MIALLLCASACVAQELAPAKPAQDPRSVQSPSSRDWRAAGLICVRLERLESQDKLVVSGVRGAAARLEIARVGTKLSVNGAAPATSEL